MGTWPHHIDRFDRKYNKALAKDPLFETELIDRIRKHGKVFLNSCNTTFIEDVESGALPEFLGLKNKVERGEWLTKMRRWVDQPTPK